MASPPAKPPTTAGVAHMLQQCRHIQAIGVLNGARMVLHGHDLGSSIGKQFARSAAHIAEAPASATRALCTFRPVSLAASPTVNTPRPV